MQHDDLMGEDVPEEEEHFIQAYIAEKIFHQEYHEGMNLRFPGSQPVSLAQSNIDLLKRRRYLVTWKVRPLLTILASTMQMAWDPD